MAVLNGKQVSFNGLTFTQIGVLILAASPSGDGTGIVLILTEVEEDILAQVSFGRVGRGLQGLIADAVEKKTGRRPGLSYRYTLATRCFTI